MEIKTGDDFEKILEKTFQENAKIEDSVFFFKVPNSSNHTHLEVGEETIVSWSSDECRALDMGTF